MRLIQGDRPTLAERIGAFFGNFGMRPAMALAGLALVAVQGGVILNLLGHVRERRRRNPRAARRFASKKARC